MAIVFGPIALAGATWDAAKGWFAKWVAFVVALILSKLVLVVIFLVAVAQVSAPIDADLASVSDPIAGIVLMFIAAFAPYITYKFISFVGFDMYHAMSSEQEAKSALNRPVPVPAAPMADSAKKILGPNGGNEKGATPPTAQTASTSPSGPGPTTASPIGSPGPTVGASSPASSGGASAGAGAGAAGAAAGVGSAGIVVGAAVAGAAAEAGPGLGNALGQTADTHTQAVGESAGPSAPTPEPEPMQPRTPTPLAEAPASASGLGRKDV